ncbi:unnamed protein product [Anisakis simplex]|uniref:Cubilin n=1 Tax=Anisakis simplex TaxID=6269 RepID=A0A158PN25_ANISI|nr:unnamed protein product [Anisakis simplex]
MRTLERVTENRIDFEQGNQLKEDCAFCRSLDCDIIFALLFTFVIACLLVLIMCDILECDHIFDSSKNDGEFQLPMLPPPATGSEHTSSPEILKNMQCIYTFVAGPRQRVKLDFEQFQLAGTADNCEMEYVDIYSELKSPHDDLLSASFGGRYCGTVSPYIRISLHKVIVLVFHSRAASNRRSELKFRGHYTFISDARYNVGRQLSPGTCSFVIDSKTRKRGTILSPTYPGTYPKNFHCSYLLNGKPGQRIRFFFRDFDIYFGGEHCPYDSMTIHDGSTNRAPIIRKVCGLQQRLELYSLGQNAFMEFNTTSPTKADPRGYVIDYEFSNRYVDVGKLLGNQKGVTHLRGSECDVRVESNKETVHYLQSPKRNKFIPAKYCARTFPGPTVSAFGSHEMRFFFRSGSQGTGNGFKALYKIRKAFKEEIPTRETSRHCGQRITRTDDRTTGWLVSPGYPIKYNKDLICDWEIKVRPGYRILLNLVKMEVEGAMSDESINCQNAVIRVDADSGVKAGPSVREICGTVESVVQPIISKNNTVRISFFTSPDKVNGLKGFNFTWTEVKLIKDDRECSSPSQYLCTYTKLCIDARLRCNGDENCGLHDDTDEAHCSKLESATDLQTVLFAATFSGCIFLFIFGFFCYLFKKKFERKKNKKRRRYATSGLKHQRQPYRSQKPVSKATINRPMDIHLLPSPATQRLTHHDITGVLPPSNHQTQLTSIYRQPLHQSTSETFYG